MNQHNSFSQASEILSEALSAIKNTITDLAHGAVVMQVETAINGIKRRLDHLAGNVSFQATLPSIINEHPPITNFMGEPIGESKLVKLDEINPGEEEKAKYLNRVQSLYDQFSSIAPEGILNSHTTVDDAMVLRGVAKKAGLEDFATADLTIPFIERIQKSMNKVVEQSAAQAQHDSQLQNQERIINLQNELKSQQAESAKLMEAITVAQKDLAEAKTDKAKAKLQSALAELQSQYQNNIELVNATADLLTQATR